jgi:hypothetical protein
VLLRAVQAAEDPMDQVEAARALREAADELELACVAAARRAGATWTEIGFCYGLTKQGAQQRFRALEGKGAAAKARSGKGRSAGADRPDRGDDGALDSQAG